VEGFVLEWCVIGVGLDESDVGMLFCMFLCMSQEVFGDVYADKEFGLGSSVGEEEACSTP